MSSHARPIIHGLLAALALAAGLPSVRPAAATTVHDPPPARPAATSRTSPPAAPRVTERPNLLFVSFDTTRRDHISAYGHDLLTTPRIDRLAAEGLLFTDALAVVPTTGPSHATMFTGQYPQVHGAFRNGVKLKDEHVTLAEVLSAEGYRTGAFLSGWTLRDQQCGLGQGFATYDDAGFDHRYNVVNLMRRADAVTDAALAWFEQGAGARPWFAFLHYFDPHEPYPDPPLVDVPPNPAASNLPRSEVHRQQLRQYDGEIAFADAQFGRLLDALQERGDLRNTLIVFTADHGQSFGDNGYGGPEGAHGRKVYQSQVAVPLVMWWPGQVLAGQRSDLPVSHVDLLPTIVDLLGVSPKPLPAGLPGASLARVAREAGAVAPWGNARRTRHALAFRGAVGNKWNIFRWAQNKKVEKAEPLCAYVLTDDGRKVIVDFANRKRVEIYDLKTDAHERRNLVGGAVAEAEAHENGAAVVAWYDHTRASDLTTAAPTAEDLEKLRSLGYVE